MHISIGLHYIHFRDAALRFTKTLTHHELSIIIQLYISEKPLFYAALMRSISVNQVGMSNRAFNNCLKRLHIKGYVKCESIGSRKYYSLTASGRFLLFQFAATLDKIVQEKLKEFDGNNEA